MKKRYITHILISMLLCATFSLSSSAIDGNGGAKFRLNISDSLTVSLTLPRDWATGVNNTFLRNTIGLTVTSNNKHGFTASMTTRTSETALTNTADSTAKIPTLLSNSTRANFPFNYWGYSLNDNAAGNTSSVYQALAGVNDTPNTILTRNTAGTSSQNIYFGTKTNTNQAAGIYSNVVVISVVTGVISEDNPVTPVNPVTPSNQEDPVYNPDGTTTTTTISSTSTTTTETTRIDSVDVRDQYAEPQGVSETSFDGGNINMPVASGVAIASGIAATTGAILLILAKRKKDDDEEEEEN